MNLWLVMILAGVGTYLIRLSSILLVGHKEFPPTLKKALKYIPTAVLSAIILPELLMKDSQLYLSIWNPRLLAGVLAILTAWRTRNVVLTILAGMLALWAITWLMSVMH